MMLKVRVFYELVDSRKIFGMVGRCGGGYNTVWEDWSAEGRLARELIISEFEKGMDAICGHYKRLEESVKKEGFRNPLIITCGLPVRKKITHLPPELKKKDPASLLLLEGTTGGSRLWVAQKLKMAVPCLINDFTGRYPGKLQVLNTNQAMRFFTDKPSALRIDRFKGILETFDNSKVGHHLGDKWSEDKIVKYRAPLWVSIMNKYGYYVDRLQPNIHEILKEAGVIQPTNLKKIVNGKTIL